MKLKLINLPVFIFVLMIFSFSAEQALACDCAAPPPVREAKEKAAAVFVGEVISIKTVRGDYSREVTLKVTKTWKGVLSSQITIMTGGGCGYFFEEGKSYLIYAYGDKEKPATGICSRTTAAGTEKADRDIKILNKLKKEGLEANVGLTVFRDTDHPKTPKKKWPNDKEAGIKDDGT